MRTCTRQWALGGVFILDAPACFVSVRKSKGAASTQRHLTWIATMGVSHATPFVVSSVTQRPLTCAETQRLRYLVCVWPWPRIKLSNREKSKSEISARSDNRTQIASSLHNLHSNKETSGAKNALRVLSQTPFDELFTKQADQFFFCDSESCNI